MITTELCIYLLFAQVIGLIKSESVTSNQETVYFVRNQKYLQFGSIFELHDDFGNANADNFQLAEAYECAVNQLEKLNLFPGSSIGSHVRDDSVLPGAMSAIANEFEIKGIVNPILSLQNSKIESFNQAYNAFKPITMIYPCPGQQVQQGSSDNMVLIAPQDLDQAKPLHAILKLLKATSISILSSRRGSMPNIFNEFVNTLVRDTTKEISIPCRTSDIFSDFEKMSNCIPNTNVRVIALFVSETEALDLIPRLVKSGTIKKDTILMGSNTWANDMTIGKLIKNGVESEYLLSTYSAHNYAGKVDLFRSCLSSRTSSISPYPEYQSNYQNSMKCKLSGSLEFCAANRDLSDPLLSSDCRCRTEDNLSKMVMNNRGINYIIDSILAVGNALHQLNFNCLKSSELLKVDSASICSDSSSFNSTLLLSFLEKSNFNGFTLDFTLKNKMRSVIAFDILQFNGTNQVLVGNWTSTSDLTVGHEAFAGSSALFSASGKASSLNASFQFANNTWKETTVIIIASLICLGLICTIGIGIFVVVYRDHPVIKRSSPLFCNLMLTGILILYVHLFLWIGMQSQMICLIKVWLPLVGFGMLMGPLLAKTFRIWKIFDNSKLRIRRLQTSKLLQMFWFVLGVNLTLLIIWTSVDPLRAKATIDSASDMFGSCTGDNENFQSIMFVVFVVYNGSLLLMGTFLSYKTRSVLSSFNESKSIAYSIYSITLCLTVLLPIYIISRNFREASFVIRSLAVIFANSSCLLIMFCPKIYHVIKGTQDITDQSLIILSPPNGKSQGPSKVVSTTQLTPNVLTTMGNSANKLLMMHRPGMSIDEQSNNGHDPEEFP